MTTKEALEKLQRFDCEDCKFAACEQCEINYEEVQAIKALIKAVEMLEDMVNKNGKPKVLRLDVMFDVKTFNLEADMWSGRLFDKEKVSALAEKFLDELYSCGKKEEQ